jgi:membrane protease YdiL (CAAX protease family)
LAVVLLPLPQIVTANAAVGRRWAHHAIAILAGFSAGVTFLFGALDVAGAGLLTAGTGGQSRIPLDVGFMVTALIAATLASQPIRETLAKRLPLDPDNPVHAFALVLAVIFFGTQVSAIFFTNLASSSQAALGVGDLVAQDVGLLVLAVAGVGIFMRRDVSQTAARLGLVRPAWWHVVLALASAGAMFAFGQAMIELSRIWTPGVYAQVNASTSQLFGGLVSTPLGIAALALAPGICEEILFRGALQPRIGLLVTAVLFTASHSEYGISFYLVSVFASAVGLGLIRRFTNTTTSAIAHVAYNLIGGISLAGSQFEIAVVIEVVLVAVSAYAIWSNRRLQVGIAESLTGGVVEPERIE